MTSKKAKTIGEACVLINAIRTLLMIQRNDARVDILEQAMSKLMETIDK